MIDIKSFALYFMKANSHCISPASFSSDRIRYIEKCSMFRSVSLKIYLTIFTVIKITSPRDEVPEHPFNQLCDLD